MDAKEFIVLHSSSSSDSGSEKNEPHNSTSELGEADSQPSSSQVKEDIVNEKKLGSGEAEGGNDDGQHVLAMELDKDLVDNPPIVQEIDELTDTVTTVEKINGVNSGVNGENGCTIAENDSTISNHKIDDCPTSGVKRARMTYVDQEPSVHVIYNSLPRASKRKLEEFLQQWSEWHAQHGSLPNDLNQTLESGEETYFPALHVGLEKAPTVSFWMDNQARKEQNKEFIPLDGDSVPLYDRGYALGLTSMDGSTNLERGLETLEASRCFNCSSYNHSLKDCPKPRDNVAVNNARKHHHSKRNQTAGPRIPTRYYQNSPGGKYDGLRPGSLGAETRQLLGLGELDPPPWLQRMREIGYPPGYLEDEDRPSGITIYAEEKTREEQEDGEILERVDPELQKKRSVEFPGINAPVPEKADERRWASSPGASSFDSSRNRFHPGSNRSSEVISKGHYSDQRRSRDYRDDGPPGCDPGVGPSMSSYIPRYSGYDPNHSSDSQSPRGNPIPRSPNLGRSLSERGRRSPLVHESPPSHGPYNSLAYSSPNTRQSPQSYGSASFENLAYGNYHISSSDLSSQRKDRQDRHHHHHHHHRK